MTDKTESDAESKAPPPMLYSEATQRTLSLARSEAKRFDEDFTGTEHLLLGLAREHDGDVARVLASLNVELARIRSAVEFIIDNRSHGGRPTPGESGLTTRAWRVLELAGDEAHRLGNHYIEPVHLLIGLMREGDGIAAGILASFGVTRDKLRAAVQQKNENVDSIPASIAQEMLAEYAREVRNFADFASPYEGYAILLEEFDQLWEKIKHGESEDARVAGLQVGVMVIRLLHDCYAARPAE